MGLTIFLTITAVLLVVAQVHNDQPPAEIKEIDFEGLHDGLIKNTLYLIDVRTPQEFKDGKIPKSINIPMTELENVFIQISNQEFQNRYGFDRQKPNRPVVFSCRSGKRSKDAINKLLSLGVKLDYLLYKGSFLDWQAKGGPIEK